MVVSHDVAICDECIGICLGTLAADPDLFEATIEQARAFAVAVDQADTSEPAL